MNIKWQGWRRLGCSVAALLLFNLAGCLFSQLRSADKPPATTPAAKRSDAPPPMIGRAAAPSNAELTLTGGTTTQMPTPTEVPNGGAGNPVPADAPLAKITFATGELCLADLIRLADQNHPNLVIARAKVDAARGQMIQSGLYPNPTLSLDWDTINTRGAPTGDPGALIAQEFVTAHKLKIARAAGASGVQATDWDAVTRWFEVMVRVRYAYIDLLAAQRGLKTAQAIVKVSQANLDAAEKLFKGGIGTRPDVLRAETELEYARVQQVKAELRITASRQLLAAAVGVPELPGCVVGDLEQAPPPFAYAEVQGQVLSQSSEVQAAQARILQMEQRLTREQVERIPNILTEFRPYYSSADRNAQIEVIIGAKVPLFNRNQGNILAAQAQLVEARADSHHVELKLTERLADAFRRYQVGREQTEAYRSRILPKARETLELVQTGYKAGDKQYSFNTVLLTQQTLFQAELTYIFALDELWRAVADIEALLQRKCE
jgi:cobalt-zinc-cadmium efflux system outer membrane protein